MYFVEYWMRFFSDRSAALEPSRLVLGRFFYDRAIRSTLFCFNSGRVQSDCSCSDQNVRQKWTACHAYLFTVFAQQKQIGNSMEKQRFC